MTWDYFQDDFQKKYVGTIYKVACKLEFIKWKQGNMTVVKYKTVFLRFSRYAHGVVMTRLDKCVRFENGLWYNMMIQVVPQS